VGVRLDPWVIAVAYDKFAEVFTRHAALDDTRGWAIGAMTDAAGFKLGLLAAYLKDDTRVRFPAGDLSYGGADFFAKGRLGAASLNAELFYGTGTIDNDGGVDTGVGGLGAYVGAFVPVGPVTLGLEGAYARGDDPRTPANEGLFSADYEGPYRSVIFYNAMDYPGYAGDPQTSDTVKDFSVRNAVSGKVSAVLSPARRLSLTAAALYAALDQTGAGVSSAMGWEFDLVAVYGITEGVSLSAGVGYAILGDYWKSAAIAGGAGGKPDNPLGAVVAVTATF
jgi:hypothetical protein